MKSVYRCQMIWRLKKKILCLLKILLDKQSSRPFGLFISTLSTSTIHLRFVILRWSLVPRGRVPAFSKQAGVLVDASIEKRASPHRRRTRSTLRFPSPSWTFEGSRLLGLPSRSPIHPPTLFFPLRLHERTRFPTSFAALSRLLLLFFFFSLLSSCHDRPLLLSLSLLPNDFPREFCSFTKSRRRGEGILPQCFILSTKISPSNLRFSRSRVQISDNLDLNLYRFSLSLSGKSHSFSMVDHQFFRFPISAAISPASAAMWKMPLVTDVYSATENTRINRGIVVKHVTIVGIPFDGESRLPREPIRPLDFESTPANPEIFRGHEQ